MESEPNVFTISKLIQLVGINNENYASLMKRWFNKEITKNNFDEQLKEVLTNEEIRFHNKFILSVLEDYSRGCNSKTTFFLPEVELQSTSKRMELAASDTTFKSLQKVDLHNHIKQTIVKSHEEEIMSKEFLFHMPDQDTVYPKMILLAWEHNLEKVQDEACKLIVDASHMFVKNILTAIISRRTGFRKKGNFLHSLGSPSINPWLRNAEKYSQFNDAPTEVIDDDDDDDDDDEDELIHVPKPKPSAEEMENKIAFELSLSSKSSRKNKPIKVDDVLDAVQMYPHLIPHKPMYSVFVEKLLLARYHPSWEDLESLNRS